MLLVYRFIKRNSWLTNLLQILFHSQLFIDFDSIPSLIQTPLTIHPKSAWSYHIKETNLMKNELERIQKNEAKPRDISMIITWDKLQYSLATPYITDTETSIAKTALKFGETEVNIKYSHPTWKGKPRLCKLIRSRTRFIKHNRKERKWLHHYHHGTYDDHVEVLFPKRSRNAHIYLVNNGGRLQFRPLEKNRVTDKRPAVVIC
jgi:hypothetical protein